MCIRSAQRVLNLIFWTKYQDTRKHPEKKNQEFESLYQEVTTRGFELRFRISMLKGF